MLQCINVPLQLSRLFPWQRRARIVTAIYCGVRAISGTWVTVRLGSDLTITTQFQKTQSNKNSIEWIRNHVGVPEKSQCSSTSRLPLWDNKKVFFLFSSATSSPFCFYFLPSDTLAWHIISAEVREDLIITPNNSCSFKFGSKMLSCFIAFILSLLLLFSATRVYLEDDKEFLSNANIVGFCDDYRWESANILNRAQAFMATSSQQNWQ